MAEGISKEQYVTGTGAIPKEKKRGIFSVVSKSTTRALSTQLYRPFSLSMKPHYHFNVSFTTEDKLIIIFGYKQKFVVYKKSNGTVAVLDNVVFKQNNPPMMFDGAKMGALLHNVKPILTYAVAKGDFCESNATIFQQNDVVLILASCREILLGLTQDHRVCFFPSEIVDIITHPRRCFFEGMMLNVKAIANFEAKDSNQLSVQRKHIYEITKGKDGLFDWFESDHLKVPLHAFGEIGTKVVIAMEGEGFYHTIQELKDKTTTPPLPPRLPIVLNMPKSREIAPAYVNNEKVFTNERVDVRSSTLENDEDIYLDNDWKFDSQSESQVNTSVSVGNLEAVEHSEKQKKDPKDMTENLSDSSDDTLFEDYEPLDQRRDPDTNDLYENQETIDDLKKEIDDLRNALQLLLISQRDKNLTKENETLYDETLVEEKMNKTQFSKDGKASPVNDMNAEESYEPLIQEPSVNEKLSKSNNQEVSRHLYATSPQENQAECEIGKLLDRLYDFRDVPINDNLRSIVAEYLEQDVWHQFGKRIKVPVNRRHKIEQEKDDIYEKTYDLLGLWHSRYGSNATLGVLLDALVEVNPEDLHLILEDICKNAEDEEGYQLPPT